ncbi:hypothetical protein [Nocardioides pantholopis]|uniref:hypothetical protein n=1 Tax=Nocardioides pantholopis TaxID=2483798 RepID=UPI000FDA0C36|nr:hypothetical protein [Nocardioides pantholopis]
MVFQAHVLKILIASPGDTDVERDAVESALGGWNASRAETEQTVLLPWRWEKHGIPVLGASAQSVINTQAVDQSDIVVALFDSRLGQATEEAVSGTAEEIKRAHEAGKPVHVWFSNEPIPRNAEVKQLAALKKFRTELEKVGLLGSYANPDDLAYQVRQAIEHDLQQLALGTAKGPKAKAGALIRSRFHYEKNITGYTSKGRPNTHTISRLYITNQGDVAAEGLTITISKPEAADADAGFRWGSSEPDAPFDLLPGAERDWPFLPVGLNSVVVHSQWSEGSRAHSEDQTISV